MTDDPSSEITSNSDDDPQESSQPDTEQPAAALKPGLLPLGPHVFGGKRNSAWLAFFITAVPFLIYWGGTAFGGYLEKTRKLAPAHTMRGECRAEIGRVTAILEELPAGQAMEVRNRIDLLGVAHAMDDENANVAGLAQQCEKLLHADFSDLPPLGKQGLDTFQKKVQHFLELQVMVEENDLNGIRKAHNIFLEEEDPEAVDESRNESWYPVNYSVACIVSLVAVILAFPGYLKIPLRVSPLAYLVGIGGIFVWIGLWYLDTEFLGLGAMIPGHSRAAFNPLDELKENPSWMYTFLAIRLAGLVLVIPIAEEFFMRGFLMRYIEDIDWDQIPMGMATWKSIVGIIVYGAVAHPGEVVAAVAWFGLVTWLYLHTKNVWDCVVAHALTNLLLAAYVLKTGTWELW